MWKLPVRRGFLWGNIGLVLMGRAMLSKSLIQFAVVRWGFVPSHRGNGDNGDFLQKDLRLHARAPRTIVFSVPDPVAGHCRPTPPLETPGHSQASLA